MKSNMKIALKQQAFFALFLFAASFLTAQNSVAEDSNTGDSGAPHPANLSLAAFVEAAKGLSLEWRPDWPLSVPPDLFYTLPGSAIAVITVSFEAPKKSFAEQAEGESAETESDGGERSEEAGVISAEWQNGRLVRFPVFLDSLFMQAAAEYDAGILIRIIGEDLEMTFPEYDERGRPLIALIFTGGSYFFVAVEYEPGGITETWYDESGFPQSVFSTDKTGDSVRIRYGENGAEAEARHFFFNSYGSISAIQAPEGTWSARYERRGFPRYLERNLGEGLEYYSFQWDEAGRLTRFSGVRGGGTVDSRFEYELDDRGNWVVRREIRMLNLSGRLFPAPGAVVRRRIQYGDKP